MEIVKVSIFCSLCLLSIAAGSEKNQDEIISQCRTDEVNISFESGGKYGFEIEMAEKTYPNFPIIVTQEEKHTGVNIVVEIRSYPGTITYEKYEETCIGYDEPQKALTSCGPYYSTGKYYYLTGACISHTETIFRYINGKSLKVWLEPTSETQEWLGWSTGNLDEDKYPLRYLFPEKWSLGTWTPDGFTTEGDTGLWTEEEIKKFLDEHPGYNFLKADPRHNEIPTQYLPLAKDPMEIANRVIPLFGNGFTSWGDFNPLYNGELCHISGRGPDSQGYCTKTVNDRTDPMFGSVDLSADNITYLEVAFSHIPMDIPGQWHIAVEVSVRHAVYDGGKMEKPVDEGNLTRLPGKGYEQNVPDHTFISYMWISTPCNLAEKDGCKN